jgi:hypothetical protein
MNLSRAHSASRRDADNELYDRACDLVEAAAGIRRCAADQAASPAIPAVLGCIEAALHELTGACEVLQQTNAEGPATSSRPEPQAVMERLERGLTHLRVALEDAETASQAARSLAARRFAAGGRGPRAHAGRLSR